MFHLTFCGGHEVRLKDSDNIVITVWGGTSIFLPTLAEKIVRVKKSLADGTEDIRRTNVITFQAGTVLRYPTVAQEIEAMMSVRESGAFSDHELLELWQEVLRREEPDHFEFLTIMGGAGEERPSVKEELKDLKRLVARGHITNEQLEDFHKALTGENAPDPKGLQEKLKALMFPARTPNELMPTRAFSNSALIENK